MLPDDYHLPISRSAPLQLALTKLTKVCDVPPITTANHLFARYPAGGTGTKGRVRGRCGGVWHAGWVPGQARCSGLIVAARGGSVQSA